VFHNEKGVQGESEEVGWFLLSRRRKYKSGVIN